ncbi:hypothetical protein [Chengkuizengella axinellae]|uniref:Uncharacterized protein n=1 Tax=Chengkuizengella axinellae TaxID=3064388 RepID=A0ABT9J199_9BACL|nr:hypothetical protein [Chengkuizengella sp. 2205SS18-9]MDP5275396.1 hypothetical protein [Chengkuizengella sp. 2205SS18-9]
MLEEALEIEKVMLKRFRMIFSIALSLFLFVLLWFFDIYPGGYSYEEEGPILVVKEGSLHKITHHIEITDDNDLEVAYLERYIIDLRTLWLTNIGLISTLIIGYYGIFIPYYRPSYLNKASYIILYTISFIFILIIDIKFYRLKLEMISNSLKMLLVET